MKRFWPRILSAFSALAVGLVAASLARLLPAPAVTVRPPCGAAEVKVRPTPVTVPEITQPPPPSEQAARPPEETMRPHPVSISPYEIKRLVDENYRAARAGRKSDLELEPIWADLKIGGAQLIQPTCQGDCDASISSIELDGRPGKETLLVLCVDRSFVCLYLIFKRNSASRQQGPGWTLLGTADAFMRWAPPAYLVVTAGGRRWLAISGVSGYGSAFGSSAENWYEVSERGVAHVLSYQSGLFIGFQNPEVRRTADVQTAEDRGGVATVVLRISTSYQGRLEFGDPFPLFTSTRKATFIKGPGMDKFVLDRYHSETAEEGLDPFNESEPVTPEDFLKYNYRELVRLAVKGNAKQREWLRNYLKDCDDGLEKQSLLTALGGAQP